MIARIVFAAWLAVPAAAQDATPAGSTELLRERITRAICGERCESVKNVVVRSVVTSRGPGTEVSRWEERSIYALGRPIIHDIDYVPQFYVMGARIVSAGTTRVVVLRSGERHGVERTVVTIPVLFPLTLRDRRVTPAVEIRVASTTPDGTTTLELTHDSWTERWVLDAMDRVIRIEWPNGNTAAYSEFRQVQGIWWPFRRTSTRSGGSTDVTIVQSVEVNGPIPTDAANVDLESPLPTEAGRGDH